MDAREIIQAAAWAIMAVAFWVSVWSIASSIRQALKALDALERERELLEIEINNELEK